MATNHATVHDSFSAIVVNLHGGTALRLGYGDLRQRALLQDFAELFRTHPFQDVEKMIANLRTLSEFHQ